MSEHAVTVLISRNVKPGCEFDFERTTANLMQTASRFDGYLGAQLIRPGEDPDVQDTMYHVVLAFDNQAHLDTWHHSAERQRGLATADPYIAGAANIRSLSGLGLWFRTSLQGPPRWKVAVVTWLGIFPTVSLLFQATADLLQHWPFLARTMVLTLAVVAVMTWGVAPLLTRLFRPWLFAPGAARKADGARNPDR
jgi:antibiotic biosynthesis monooxygenase (ABM) superfamily enzyme